MADLSEDGAHVAVTPGMFDRRKREVHITVAGRQQLKLLEAALAAAELRALRPLRRTEQERLKALVVRALPERLSPIERWLRRA